MGCPDEGKFDVMSVFSGLQVNYARWRESHLKYERDSAQFVLSLAAGLLKHIDAPATYEVRDDCGAMTKRYVEPIKVIVDQNGHMQCHSPASPVDVLTRSDKDGYWVSGIRLVIDQAANVFPKDEFNFMIQFILRERSGEAEVAGQTFKFQTGDPNALVPIYAAIVDSIEKALAQPPWGKFPSKQYIGFKFPAENDD
jgi:hypothetical protein